MNNISEAKATEYFSRLSKAIASIEDELGVALFDRKGRHIYLNRYGELMLNYIDSAFRELNEGERIIKELTGIESGQVTFAEHFHMLCHYSFKIMCHDIPILKLSNIKQYLNGQSFDFK